MTKRLSIMGATGSVGRSALGVVEHANAEAGEDVFEVEALTANSDVDGLARQAKKFGAKHAVIADAELYGDLKAALSGTNIQVSAGEDALLDVARLPVDRLVAAIVGIAGLRSTHAALSVGNSVALANKESMVCAGPLLSRVAAETGGAIVPTDSEHNAIFQVLERLEDVERLILTASGGPFLDTPLKDLKRVTPEQACAHPNWSMGRKISVDSASFMNKALEVIEASYLFGVPEAQIDVVVHRQSIVHSLVAYRDGSLLAQLGAPDMQTPIAHALSWPDRRLPTNVEKLTLERMSTLSFLPVDADRFPAIGLARRALNEGQAACILMNCANEVAVAAFLEGNCRFIDISSIVERALGLDIAQAHHSGSDLSLDDVIALDTEGRVRCGELVAQARSEAQ